MAEPIVKTENMGSPLMEDDPEDAGDVDFYVPLEQNDKGELKPTPASSMYLTKLPSYLWEQWSRLSDDAEIELGEIRQIQYDETDAKGQIQKKTKLQLRLRSDLAQHQLLPKEYNLEIPDPHVKNTFIFSEQDLPSYAAKNREKAAAMAQGIPAHLLRQQQKPGEDKPQEQQRGKKRRWENARRAVPKKTKIEGKIAHELACNPMENEETDLIFITNALEAQRGGPKARFLQSYEEPTNVVKDNDFDGFIHLDNEVPTKAKKQENKTARWAENELLDRIAAAFADYRYWSMKAIRARIPQPEQYIRETLEKVAVLNRTGSFANNWSLKPEFEQTIMGARDLAVAKNESAAPAAAIAEEDEEDDIKMEDVL